MKSIIKNGRLINPKTGIDGKFDILISNGVVEQIAPLIDVNDAEIIDASGLIVSPGLIDIHCHLREPGFCYKEDILSGTAAAAAGGFTTACAMPNTKPVVDTPELTRFIKNADSLVRVLPIAAVTEGQFGVKLNNFTELKDAGAVAFSDDGRPVVSGTMMEAAMRSASSVSSIVISHCEDLGVDEYDSETVMAARDIELAKRTNLPLHLAHISKRASIELIEKAKGEGVQITAETCPHYFSLTENKESTNFKMNPPLGKKEDVAAVIYGIKAGVIDCISTDHAPHSKEEKEVPYEKAPNGILGLQTAFSAAITYLSDHISLSEIIALMTYKPAEILSLPYGSIEVGKVADIVLFDLHEEFIFNEEDIVSKSKNSPYIGMRLKGKIKKTIYNGKVVYHG